MNFLSNIKNKVKAHQHIDGRIVVYINVRTTISAVYNSTTTSRNCILCNNPLPTVIREKKKERIKKNNSQIRHNLRIRESIYGCVFLPYHPEMDFTLASNQGWKEIN